MHHTRRAKRQTPVRCTLCGREITVGEEYWDCNASRICCECLPEYARQELTSPFNINFIKMVCLYFSELY